MGNRHKHARNCFNKVFRKGNREELNRFTLWETKERKAWGVRSDFLLFCKKQDLVRVKLMNSTKSHRFEECVPKPHEIQAAGSKKNEPSAARSTSPEKNQVLLKTANLRDELEQLGESLNDLRGQTSIAERKQAPLNIIIFDLLNEIKQPSADLETRKLTVKTWEKMTESLRKRFQERETNEPQSQEDIQLIEMKIQIEKLMEFKRWMDSNPKEVEALQSGKKKNDVEDDIGQKLCQISAMELKIRGIQRQLDEVYREEQALVQKRIEHQQDVESKRILLQNRISQMKAMIDKARKKKEDFANKDQIL